MLYIMRRCLFCFFLDKQKEKSTRLRRSLSLSAIFALSASASLPFDQPTRKFKAIIIQKKEREVNADRTLPTHLPPVQFTVALQPIRGNPGAYAVYYAAVSFLFLFGGSKRKIDKAPQEPLPFCDFRAFCERHLTS